MKGKRSWRNEPINHIHLCTIDRDPVNLSIASSIISINVRSVGPCIFNLVSVLREAVVIVFDDARSIPYPLKRPPVIQI